MPISTPDKPYLTRHTESIDEIITSVPSWILRWGITVFFVVLALVLGMSAFFRYPDIVKTQLKVTSFDVPKQVVSKINGKLIKLLITENDTVKAGQALAYLESTGDHDRILKLLDAMKRMQVQVSENEPVNTSVFNASDYSKLGELQNAYESFTQLYFDYKSTLSDGYLIKKRYYLQNDLVVLQQQERQFRSEISVQERDLRIAEEEYAMHKKLAQQKVETPAELRQQESKYLSRKLPVVQTENALMTVKSNVIAKQKEIVELENEILKEKSAFIQGLNSLVSQAEDWKSRYVLSAPQPGTVTFAGVIQQNQVLEIGQNIFNVNRGGDQFFGEMIIPQANMGKVKKGQEVLIKLKSYPFEEYGIMKGFISYLSDIPYRDSAFISKVKFKPAISSNRKLSITLKQGMIADAEIITEDASIFQRITRNVVKAMNIH